MLLTDELQKQRRKKPDSGAATYVYRPAAFDPGRAGRWSWERLGRWLFVAVLVGCAPLVLVRTMAPDRSSDFPRFHQSGRYVLEHRTRLDTSEFSRYWPSLDAAAAVLAWMPLPMAAVIWYAVGCVTWIGFLSSIRRHLLPDADATVARQAALAAGLLVMPLAMDHFCLGAFHILMAWLMLAGLARAGRGQELSGGALVGLAIWLKLLPAIGAAYLLWKRRWKAALVAGCTAMAVNAALSLAAYGPAEGWRLNRQWFGEHALGTTHRLLADKNIIDEDRYSNQSLPVVMRRTLTRMGYEFGIARQRIGLADLDAREVGTIYALTVGALGLGLAVFCRRGPQATSPAQSSTEIALVLLSTLWFAPVLWSYHPVVAAPALAIIMAHKLLYPRTVWLTAGLWLAAMGLLASDLARNAGVLLWTSLAVGAILWTLAAMGRVKKPGPPQRERRFDPPRPPPAEGAPLLDARDGNPIKTAKTGKTPEIACRADRGR